MSKILLSLLRPLVRRNYRQRRKGILKDRGYWVDLVALTLGANQEYYETIDE